MAGFKVGSIYGTADMDTTDWDKGMLSIEDSTKEAKNSITKSLVKIEDSFTGLTASIVQDTNKYEVSIDSIGDATKDHLTRAGRIIEVFKDTIGTISSTAKNIKTATVSQFKSMASTLGSVLSKVGTAIKNNFSSIVSGITNVLGSIKNIALSGFAVFSTAVLDASKVSETYIKSIANINTLMTKADGTILGVSKAILGMDNALGDATELAAGMYQAMSAGAINAADGLQIVKDAAIFGKAALVDVSTAVDILTSAVNAYGKENMTTTRAADIFFKTVEEGKITGQQLAATIGKAIPVFASAGISLEEMAAGLASMTKIGVKARESTTQLNAIVNSFLKPSFAMRKELERLNYDTGAAFLKAEGLAGAVKLVTDAADGNASKMKALTPNIRALRGVMALGVQEGRLFEDALNKINNSAGAAITAFDKQEKSYDTFKSSLKETRILAGNVINFIGHGIADALSGTINKFNDFMKSEEGLNIIAEIGSTISMNFRAVKEAFDEVSSGLGKGFDVSAFKNIFTTIITKIIEFGTWIFRVNTNIKLFIEKIMLGFNEAKNFFVDISNGIEQVSISSTVAIFSAAKKQKKIRQDALDKAVKGEEVRYNKEKELRENNIKDLEKEYEDKGAFLGAFNKAIKKGQKEELKLWEDRAEAILFGTAEMNKAISEGRVEAAAEYKRQLDEMNIGEDSFRGKSLDAWQLWAFTTKSIFIEVFSLFKQVADEAFTSIDTISQTFTDAELFRLDKDSRERKTKYDRDLAALRKQLKDGTISVADFDTQKLALKASMDEDVRVMDEKSAEEKNKILKKQFETNKKFSIAQVWIDHAASVMGFWKAMASAGPPGWIAAGIMSTLNLGTAIAQTAKISRQSFIPARKDGGMASGLTRVNEEGGEIQKLADNTLVIPNDISQMIARNTGNTSGDTYLNVSFAGANIKDDFSLKKIVAEVSKQLGGELRLARA